MVTIFSCRSARLVHCCRLLAKLSVLLLLAPTLAAVTVDGSIGADEWREAKSFSNFVSLQPLTGEPIPPAFATTARLLATEAGLAVAISALQPPEIARVNSRVQRDFRDQVDRINFMVDFDADGRAGYAFTVSAGNDIADEVITNEVQFNADW